MTTVVRARIRIKRDTSAVWTAANPTLKLAEPAEETDTGLRKIGDGVTAWNDLPYDVSSVLAAALEGANDGEVFRKTASGELGTARPLETVGVLAYDDFQRSDRAVNADTAPSGQAWIATDTGTGIVPPTISEGKCVSTETGYATLDCELAPDQVALEFTFEAGSTIFAAAGLIVSSWASGNPGATHSVHCAIGPNTWSLSIWEFATPSSPLTSLMNDISLVSGTFTTPLVADGKTVHRVVLTKIGQRIAVDLPDGTSQITKSDPRVSRWWGRYVIVEQFRPLATIATDTEPRLTRVVAKRTPAERLSLSVPNGAGARNVGVPGVGLDGTLAAALAANVLCYWPFEVRDPISLEIASAEVSTAASSGAKARAGIYEATPDWQPNFCLQDMGEVATDSTGVKTWPASAPLRLIGAGKMASCSDQSGFTYSGNPRFAFVGAPDKWSQPAFFQVLGSQWDVFGNQRSWALVLPANTNKPRFYWSPDGSTINQVDCTVAPTVTDATTHGIRAKLTLSTGALLFEESADGGSTWTTLDTIAGAGATTVFDSGSSLRVGGWSDGTSTNGTWPGTVTSAKLEVGSTTEADPTFDNSKAVFTDSEGNIWTAPAGFNLLLPVGRYLIALNTSASASWRMFSGVSPNIPMIAQAGGAAPFVTFHWVSQSYAALAAIGTAWNQRSTAGVPYACPVRLEWVPASI